MEPAENRLLRFPEDQSGDSHEAAEVREEARLLVLIAEADPQALELFYRRRGGLTVREEGNPAPAWPKDSNRTALDIVGLRRQIAVLSNHITLLSQSVTQQQELLLETNRLKFFQLTPFAEGGPNTNMPVSPGLQRALFLAMAR